MSSRQVRDDTSDKNNSVQDMVGGKTRGEQHCRMAMGLLPQPPLRTETNPALEPDAKAVMPRTDRDEGGSVLRLCRPH